MDDLKHPAYLIFRDSKDRDLNNFLLEYPNVPRVGDFVADRNQRLYSVEKVMWNCYLSSFYKRKQLEVVIIVNRTNGEGV